MRSLIYGAYIEAAMAADYLITSQQWARAEKIVGLPPNAKRPIGPDTNPYEALGAVARIPTVFARGLAAAMSGSPEARKSVAAFQEIAGAQIKAPIPFIGELQPAAKIQALEISAVAHATRGEFDAAIATMKKVAGIVDGMPPPAGPPALIKPAHELFGEILLSTNRSQEAAEQFAISLRRHPNRSRSLLGATRAFAQAGETQRAVKFYGQFARQWQEAKCSWPNCAKHGILAR